MFDSVRLRLTVWYVVVTGLILVASSITVYVLVARELYERVDAGLHATMEVAISVLQHQRIIGQPEPTGLQAAFQEFHFPHQAIALFDHAGRLLREKTSDESVHIRLPPFDVTSINSRTFYSLPERTSESDDSCRGIVARFQIASSDQPYVIVVNESLQAVEDKLDLLQDLFYIGLPVALTLTALGGWLLVCRSLAPVLAMSEQAQRIGAENLEQRLPTGNPRDELGRLATTFNGLLTRLSESFSQQRQFMADASHELRSPVSAIRTACAVILQREDRASSEYRDALAIVEQQARRLTRIVEDMLLLARADAGNSMLRIDHLYLDELLVETTRGAAVLAAQKNLQLEISVLPESSLRGDESLLRQMFWNLLDNAIKYTPNEGRVRIALESQSGQYVITVSDTGTGIPTASQPYIFERFYRADQTRSRTETGPEFGAGLGLSIVRWITEAHHGRVDLQRSDQTGSTFVVYLPRG
jgi:heavy metal sensor kinase